MGLRVSQLREAKGWSGRQFAKKASLTNTYVGMLERGEIGNPRPLTRQALAAALGWPSFELMMESDAMEPPAAVVVEGPSDTAALRSLIREEMALAMAEAEDRPPPGTPTRSITDAEPGQLIQIPIHATVRGNFRGFGERAGGSVWIDPAEFGYRDMAAVNVEGQCMAPDVPDGSVAIYEVTNRATRGDIVIATLLDEGEDGSFVIKEYRQIAADWIELVPREGLPQKYRKNRVKIEGIVWEARKRLR